MDLENKIITVNSINQIFVFNFFFIYFLKKREGFGDMIFFSSIFSYDGKEN